MAAQSENDLIKPSRDSVTYEKYLKVKSLTGLQHLLSDPPHHDETLFIIIHQVYELWFKQILHEMKLCQDFLDRDELMPVFHSLKRVDTIQKVLVHQVDVLETMAPNEFNAFRENLNPASGFQSYQFRLLEYMLGLKNPNYLKYHEGDSEVLEILQNALEKPSIYDRFLAYLKRAGLEIPQEVCDRDFSQPHKSNDRVVDCFAKIYRDPDANYPVYLVLEALLDLDEQFILWRYRHFAMVQRMIGSLKGTGGSAGAAYLATTLQKRCFPEIWDVRNLIGKY